MKMFGSFSRPFALLATASLLGAPLFAASQTGQAKVTKIKGNAQIDSMAAAVGDIAKSGSVVSTGHDSKAYLFLGINGPNVSVLADSKLAIEELSYDDAGAEPVAHTTLALKAGMIEGNVKKSSSQSTFNVTTPTTTAAIRGTKFTVTTKGEVVVWDGCVDVKYGGANFNVCKGQVFDPAIGGTTPGGLTAGGVIDIPANYPIQEPNDFNIPGPNGPNGPGDFNTGDDSVGTKIYVSPVGGVPSNGGNEGP